MRMLDQNGTNGIPKQSYVSHIHHLHLLTFIYMSKHLDQFLHHEEFSLRLLVPGFKNSIKARLKSSYLILLRRTINYTDNYDKPFPPT